MELIYYEKLVNDYEESLTTVLRGFRPAFEFIDTWVPDEDTSKSILNIVEAAEIAGKKTLKILIGKETLKNLDVSRLQLLTSPMGKVSFEETQEGLIYQITLDSNKTDPFDTVLPCYREKLQQSLTLSSRLTAKDLSNTELTEVKSIKDSIVLRLAINPDSHTIEKAEFTIEAKCPHPPEVMEALMKAFCHLLLEIPIQEASDHSVSYLEKSLRNDKKPMTVRGILSIESTDPIFSIPQYLIRDALIQYRAKSGLSSTQNFYETLPKPEWLALAEWDKLKRIKFILEKYINGEKVPQLVKLESNVRVIVNFENHLDSIEKGTLMMKIERELKNELDPSLQIYLEELKDKNLNRRL